MAINEEYMCGWNDHAKQFSISFSDLFESKELMDVTLVADGYLFNVHRLVLAAMSPHFRQMFIQVPANQQAFVFIKDVPKQVLSDLITFIYCGQVKVSQENFEDFLNTAKAFEIKGLANGCYQQAFNLDKSKPIWSKPTQYQSTRTVHIPKANNSSDFDELPNDGEYQFEENFVHGNGYGMDADTNYEYDTRIDGPSMLPIDLTFEKPDNRCNGNIQQKIDAPEAKRIKRNYDTTEYNIVANIRTNNNGVEYLHHDNFKLTKYGKCKKTQPWRCQRSRSLKCPATVSTMQIDGVIMMKVLNASHTHQPEI